MFKLLKGGHCFGPEDMGIKDILIVGNKIYKIEEQIPDLGVLELEVIDCSGRFICPGFIDQHVHITGGGGEEGPGSRIPELMLGEILTGGITTLVGVLGVDGITRNISGLLAKARALEFEGITTYIYTGSYGVPTATLTGKAISDIALIDKVIGIGEIAIADYRSSHPSGQMLKELASEARIGGLLGGKAGVLHIHVGDGKEGMTPLFELVEKSDFPIEMFVPTHLNRNKALFEQALEYGRLGGHMDLTAGETSESGYSVSDAMEIILKSGINTDLVSVSSDGNGSMPVSANNPNGVGKVSQLFEDIQKCIFDKKISMEIALKIVTSNVAKILKVYPIKGKLSPGSDADILVLDKTFGIQHLLVQGKTCIENGSLVCKGRFES
ncbi:MAG: beta-aspartyl-peptidase [Clostridiales bacterium]|nr:beta-aspartyl-peptidase [Clostridiales bacterium]